MQQKKYVEKLEGLIKQMIRPLRGIPLTLVVEAISGHKIIPFNKKDEKDAAVLRDLIVVAKRVAQILNLKGVVRPRPNEVGNDIEVFVKAGLNKIKFRATVPVASSGKKKSMGYPDIEFHDNFGRLNYLECKTFNIDNVSTTQRSFYLSPSEDCKITADAHHFVLSFEIFVSGKRGKQFVFKCKGWKILSIENLEVDVKYEFNASNARLYSKELVLAEGRI